MQSPSPSVAARADLKEMFEHTMSTVLIVAAVGVVAAVAGVATLWFRSEQSTDMGSVSHTWVAELRAGEPYDSNR